MRQAAKYDLHATEGLARIQHLRFVLPSGEVDTQYNGMTIRGGVMDDGVREMTGSEVINGRCALQIPRLAEGCHGYDVLVSGNGVDQLLLAGVMHVAPRVTPVGVGDHGLADYLDIVIPEDEGDTITVISESPAWVDDAVERSLQERGVYITPVPGDTTLRMTVPGANITNFNFYTFPVGTKYLIGHVANDYLINSVTITAIAGQNDGTIWMSRLYRYQEGSAPGQIAQCIAPAQWSSIQGSTSLHCTWHFGGVPVSIHDRLILQVYALTSGGGLIDKLIRCLYYPAKKEDLVGTIMFPQGSADLPWTSYCCIAMRLGVSYEAGVSLGGVELGTREHFDALADSVTEIGPQVHADAVQVELTVASFAEQTVPQAVSSITAATGLALDAVSQAQTAATEAITPLVSAAQTAAGNAAQSSTAASTAATSAQQALAAMPTVDEAGNMTLTGRLTANGATVNGQLNANGGVNIPVPPATDTDGVNRLYAAGLSAVIETMRVPLYLSKSKSTLTQGAFTEPVPGQVLSAPVAAKSRQMLSIGLDYTMHAASNYSQGLGWVLPLHSTVYGQLKVSVSYGHGVYTAASSDDMDAYEIYPTDASKLAYGAAIDIYLDRTNIGGNRAAVRTRVIYHDQVTGWMVRTVTAHVDIFNTGLIGTMSAIVYQQHSDRGGSGVKPDHGSIWLIRNGMASKNIVKIADVPGIHCFSGAKLNSPVLINGKAEDIYANVINVGAPMMQLACGNGRNPAYYGFQSVETNAVISMTTAPYEPFTDA